MHPLTRQIYQERLLRVQLFIQENLDDPMPLEELARIAHFSPFHFHRIFRGMTGESVAGYVRRLRTERAAMFLRHSRRPVTRIAFEAGYESHEAFTRAFRSRFGLSPSAYRKRAAERVPPAATVPSNKAALSRFVIPKSGENTMKIEIREVPEMRVAFVRHVGPYNECGHAWNKLLAWAGPRGLLGAGTRFIGVSHDDPEVTSPQKVRYDACVTIERDTKVPDGISIRAIGGGRYAMATHHGPYEKLSDTYAALCGQWAPEGGHELRSAPCLEEYLNSPDDTEPDELLTDVYIPIE